MGTVLEAAVIAWRSALGILSKQICTVRRHEEEAFANTDPPWWSRQPGVSKPSSWASGGARRGVTRRCRGVRYTEVLTIQSMHRPQRSRVSCSTSDACSHVVHVHAARVREADLRLLQDASCQKARERGLLRFCPPVKSRESTVFTHF